MVDEVVGDVTWNVVRRDGYRHAKPSASGISLAKFYAIDEKFDVDKIAFLQSRRCAYAVIFVSTWIESQLLNDGRCANASNAKVCYRSLLKESFDRVVAGQLRAASGRKSPDQVLILVKR